VVLHLLRGIVQVRHSRLLLEDVFDIFDTATHPDLVCLLGCVDRCAGKSSHCERRQTTDRWMKVTLICMQCQPIEKFWDHDLPGICRLTPMISLFGAGIPHFILEVVILLCPLIEIWRLHLSTTKKLAVGAMFMSGIFVCGSALGTIIHTVALAKKVNQDLTWDGLDDQIWAVCDVNLASFASKCSVHHHF
jgi:hypothetical protein